MNNISQYVLENVFNKHVCENGEVIYWRDCVLKDGMINGEQGYMWIFSNGENLHSYRTPEQAFGKSKDSSFVDEVSNSLKVIASAQRKKTNSFIWLNKKVQPKNECYNCTSFNPKASGRYKCMVANSCPAVYAKK